MERKLFVIFQTITSQVINPSQYPYEDYKRSDFGGSLFLTDVQGLQYLHFKEEFIYF